MASASPLTDDSLVFDPKAVGSQSGFSPLQQKEDPKLGQAKEATDDITKRVGEIPPPSRSLPPYPKMVEPPPPPKPEDTSPIEAWGSLAMLAAALGGARSRFHATTALNAAGDALKGLHQKDQEKFKDAMERWNAANENTNRIANYQQQAYAAAMGRTKMDFDQWVELTTEERQDARAKLYALTISNQDARGQRHLEQDDMKLFLKEKEDEWKAQAAKEKEEEKIQKTEVMHSPEYKTAIDRGDYEAAQKMLAAAGDRKALDAVMKDEKAKTIAESIKKGDQPPVLTGLYGSSAAVRAELEKQGVDVSQMQVEWDSAKRQIQSLNGPQMIRFIGLSKSVVNTIDEVKNLSKQMDLWGMPLANRGEIAAFLQAEGNTPNGQLAARYVAAVNTLKEEFASLAQGGYAPHEAVWELANQQVNADYGVKELGASLDEIQRLINYRVRAISDIASVGPGSPNRYIGSGGEDGSGKTPDKPPAPSSDEAPKKVTDKAAFDALPSGTLFVAPDGSTRRKP